MRACDRDDRKLPHCLLETHSDTIFWVLMFNDNTNERFQKRWTTALIRGKNRHQFFKTKYRIQQKTTLKIKNTTEKNPKVARSASS